MSSEIVKDFKEQREAIEREDRRVDEMIECEQERIDRERPWEPAKIVYESEWLQDFGEEAKEFIGLDDGKYYWAFTRSPAEDEEVLYWQGPYHSRELADKALSERTNNWQDHRGEIEDAYEQGQIAAFQKRMPIRVAQAEIARLSQQYLQQQARPGLER